MNKRSCVSVAAYGLLLLTGLSFAACKDNDASPADGTGIQPTGTKPEWGPTIDPQNQAVIEQLLAFGTPPLPTLTPRQARMTPSPTDAMKTLLKKNDIQVPERNVSVSQRVIPSAAPDGTLLRIYTPTSASVAGGFPVIVFYHGGGWVIGSLNQYEPSCKALAEKVGAVVVSVDYRLSPEAKFPAAHEDAYSAYVWVRNNTAAIGGNPAKIAVAGESAGGNMAVGVSLLAKERGVALPVHQLLVYPVADNNLNTASYNQYANAQPLNRAGIVYFTTNYFTAMSDGDNRLISLVDVADLTGLPPATIIGAEIDPLQTEGKSLADKFQSVGVPTTYQLYPGTTHEFFGLEAVIGQAGRAQDFAAQQLKATFAK
ncbi:alpha/beta hydrolase fold domain-containing protein [Fibrella aquatica]|uniref:alpha/beta hydrolase fold domain-containing protein n=1 Tax=Fibrella aquatica TaxID=3242487 RepID=UPI0035219A1B